MYGDEIGIGDDLSLKGRFAVRTPMQWGGSKGAGFTAGEPWLPLAGDPATANVATQRDDPRSMLSLHRELLALRRADPALLAGAYARHAATARPLRAASSMAAMTRKSASALLSRMFGASTTWQLLNDNVRSGPNIGEDFAGPEQACCGEEVASGRRGWGMAAAGWGVEDAATGAPRGRRPTPPAAGAEFASLSASE